MAQAESITTAVRELMSRGEPPKSTSPRAAHTELVAAIAGNPPPPIRSSAKAKDLQRRADHLQRVFAALHVYATAIVAEIAEKIPGSKVDRHYLDSLFQQFSADASGIILDAAAELRGHENWKAL
jgi:hypothetical protein